MNRKWLPVVCVGLSGCAASGDQVACTGFEINRQAWHAESSLEGEPSARQRIADHVVGCHSLQGRRLSEVQALLGHADETATGPEGHRELVYLIGEERGLIQVDSEWLHIRLRNHRVAEATIGS